jgi:NADH-quinone oxidoreductase subunit G
VQGNFPIGLIGEAVDLTYPYAHVGEGPDAFAGLSSGAHGFAEILKNAKKPMIILGQGALARPDGAAVLAAAWQLGVSFDMLNAEWHGFNVLHTAAARVGAMDLGFLPGPGGKDLAGMLNGGVDVLWLLGADEFDTSKIGPDTFVIYQGHHGDAGAARADVILPGAAYTEKDGIYVNLEGRAQQGFMAVRPPGEAREDWRILRAISAYLGHALPYDNLLELRAALAQANPVFGTIGEVRRLAGMDVSAPMGAGELASAVFYPAVVNYYQTDPISRASPTMAACVATHYGAVAEAAE